MEATHSYSPNHSSNPSVERRYQRDVGALRILIVDDEESILWALSQNLALINENYVIGTATSAEEALAILNTSAVDVLITDLRLPKMDGLTLIDEARRISPETKVILMTAYGGDTIEREAQRRNVAAYIEKPFSIEVLIRALGDQDDEILNDEEDDERPISLAQDSEVRSPLERSLIKPAFRDRSDWGGPRSIPSEVLRLQNERRPPKLVRDFSEEELALSPEPPLEKRAKEEQPKNLLDELFLLPEEDLVVSDLPLEVRLAKVRELVEQGINQFKNYQLEEARVCWLRALNLDRNCTQALKNLKILERILKTKTC